MLQNNKNSKNSSRLLQSKALLLSAQKLTHANNAGARTHAVSLIKATSILVAFFVSVSLLIPSYRVDESTVIKNSALKQNSTIVAGGAPIKWSMLVKKSEITDGSYLLKLPQEAKNIKIEPITISEAQEVLEAPTQIVPLTEREDLALARTNNNQPKELIKLTQAVFVNSFKAVTGKVLSQLTAKPTNSTIVDLSNQTPINRGYVLGEMDLALPSEGVSELVAEAPLVPQVEAPVIEPLPATTTQTEIPVIDNSNLEPLPETPVPPVVTSTVTEESPEIPAEVPLVSVPSVDVASTTPPEVPIVTLPAIDFSSTTEETASSTDDNASTTEEFVKIDFETPAPIITEENTDTGKLVTVSDPVEDPEVPMVDVLASTKIPPIYKVGQENKIHIKWKNNGDQVMSFNAHDTDEDGMLDYVEWTVPHLSDQIFEIIFISKAFLLDADQNIIGDIYEQVQIKDNVYAPVTDGQFVRATFESNLDSSKDLTVYAKPASGTVASIEVYPVYTDADGNQTPGPKISLVNDGINPDFSNIDHDGKYRILLSNLSPLIGGPTDVFDLKINGVIEIDNIIDPSPATYYWTGTPGASINVATNWTTDVNGACGVSTGGAVPTTGDTAIFSSACTSTAVINVNWNIATLTLAVGYSGTVTQTASTTISGDLTVASGTLAVGTNDLAVTGNSTINGTLTIGASTSTGWTTTNLTIGAGGTASSTAPGTIYYNQVTVTGTLSPDITDTFTVAGISRGYPYYKSNSTHDNGSGTQVYWYIQVHTDGYYYFSRSAPPTVSSPNWYIWPKPNPLVVAGTYNPNVGATGNPVVANVTASGEYTRLDNSKITIAGNYNQSATSSKFLAGSSLITVNGNGTFVADGTVDQTQYNNSSLVLNGTNNLTYNHNTTYYRNGFNNLSLGQNGNTTTISSLLAINNLLTVGSGTLSSPSVYLYFYSAIPLSFDVNSRIVGSYLVFWGTNETIPTLVNGYDVNIELQADNASVTQTGNITLNGAKRLSIDGESSISKRNTWNTGGYNLTIGGDLKIGAGADTGLKKLDATSGSTSTRNSIITVGGNWLNYGNGVAPSQFVAASSTVIFTATSTTRTITNGSTTSPFYNLTVNGAGSTFTLADNTNVNGDFNITAGGLAIGVNNLAVTGNSTVTNATTTIGVSSSTGWTTNNLTIGANGTASSTAPVTIYYNQVTVSGTLSPDASGTYTVVGMYAGKPYYQRGSDNFFLSSGGGLYYYISTEKGAATANRWYRLISEGISGTFGPLGTATGSATVANVTASGEYTRLDNSKITIAGNYDQSATSSKFLAASSLITVNGNGTFTADGTLAPTQYNGTSLVLNGNNTVNYNNLSGGNGNNGFNNLTTGQNGNTTTLNLSGTMLTIRNALTIGSGVLAGSGQSVYLLGANPLSFDVSSRITISLLNFNSTGNQTIPTLVNGYDCLLRISGSGTVVTQTGNVTTSKDFYLNSFSPDVAVTWKTDGYNLGIGGGLQIGRGSDTVLKKLDTTSPTSTRNSTITIGGNWLNYGNGTVPSQFIAASSTVIFNSTTTGRTIASGATNSPFNAVQFNGVGGAWTLQDNLTASSTTLTNGTLIDNAKTVTVNGNILIANTANLLTSTGYWIQGASGNISNPSLSNSFKGLTIAGSGVTTTLTGSVWVGRGVTGGGSTTMGPGTLRQSSNSYTLFINPQINDAITVNNLSAGSQIYDMYIIPTVGFTQKSITLPDNFVTHEIQIDNVWGSWMATGDWNFGNNTLVIFAETANVPTLYTNMGSSALTVGALKMGFYGGINHGYLKLGSSANHSIASISRSNAGATSNIINFGSSTVAVAGNINFSGITVVPGSSTVNLISTSSSAVVTSTGQSFYNLTVNGSGGTYTLADNASVLGNLNVTAGTLSIGVNNLAVTGNSTITNATTTIGVSSSTGWTTNNLTIGAGGTASSTAPGTIYYNQVTVSGTLSPDASGSYAVAGMYNGKPYYRRGSDSWYLFFHTNNIAYYISQTLGSAVGGSWYNGQTPQTVPYGPVWSPTSSYTGSGVVTNVTASGEYTRLDNSKITIAGNFDQSATSSKFLAASSLITVNGNGAFTADGTIVSTQYNSASLVLNGVNTLTYNNVLNSYTNGLNNLVVGQGGNTTTLASTLSIKSRLIVGSGSITKSGNNLIYLSGADPLSFDLGSRVSVYELIFNGANQLIPTLANGYDCYIETINNTTVTQTGNIVINGSVYWLAVWGGGGSAVATWKTDGYNLTVGGILRIGNGNDSGLKKLDATNYRSPGNGTSTITVGGNWLNYGNGTVPSQFIAASSTVIFNKISGTQTLTAGGNSASYPFYNLTHSGAGTLQLITNPVTVTGDFTNSGGTFDANGQDVNVAGNWNNTASFLHGTSTVNLIGTVAQAVMGSSTFYNLTKSVTEAATLTFEAAKTQVITGALTLQGVANQLLSLVSSIPGASWFINPLGSTFLNFLNISDAVNSSVGSIIATNSKNSGNNSNLTFASTTVTWTGASSTDWNTAGNWDVGYVPNTTDNVIIATASNQPVLSTSTTVNNLTVNSGATLAIGSNNLTVTGNSLINGTTTIGASSSTGWSTTNLTIGAGGTASSTAPGTIYYNQVTVSGTLSPDASGTYTVGGIYNGVPWYRRGTDNFWIWKWTTNGYYYIGPSAPGGNLGGSGTWYNSVSGNTVTGSYLANGAPTTGTATVANVTASGEYSRLNNSKITISGNYDQSATSSKFLAASSLITVNGNGAFTADGTLDGTQYNGATIALNGTNTLAYVNISRGDINGFNNLIVGQNGNIVTFNNSITIKSILTIGSGSLTGSGGFYLSGPIPLSFDTNSRISIAGVVFSGTNQILPPINNGYDCGISIGTTGGTVVTQTGNVVINSNKILSVNAIGYTNRSATFYTNGYNLTVGGNLQIGAGSDSVQKSLNAVSGSTSTRNSIITVGGNWLNYGNGTAPSQFIAASSTVVFTATSTTRTITSGSSTSAFYNLTINGAGSTFTMADNASVTGDLNVTAGTLGIGVNNLAVTGNSTVTNATTTIGVSSSTGWTTNNLMIGAGGTASSTALGTIYYNQVTVSGTLSPDASGTYTVAGMYDGRPYWTNGTYFMFWTSDRWRINAVLGATTGFRWAYVGDSVLSNAYQPNGGSTGTATVANVTASGEYTRLGVSKVSISGNYDQSSASSKFFAASSLITFNGNGTFTADGTLATTQFNGASLVLNGVNTLTYSNLSGGSGFNNLSAGQNGNTTTIASTFYVMSSLTVGSGSLFGNYSISLYGPTPLIVDTTNSVIAINSFIFRASGPQSIPSLTKGYDCSFDLRGITNQILTQTGNVTLNGSKYIYLGTMGGAERINSWRTDGYDLIVGGSITIGANSDSGRKTLDATNYRSPGNGTSTIAIGGNWLNYGTGSAPSQFVHGSSTVIMTGTSASGTLTSGAANSPFYNLTQNGTGTTTLQDNLVVAHDLTLTNGTLDTKSGSNYSVTIGSASPVNGSFTQSTSSKFMARSSVITLNGNGNFTANGTLDSTQFNSSSLILNGSNNLAYGNLTSATANGFYNLTASQNNSTTTLNNHLAIGSVLIVGSGNLSGSSITMYLLGENPINADASSLINLYRLSFGGTNQSLAPFNLGIYNIYVQVWGANTIITQTGNITLGINTQLALDGANVVNRLSTWKTDGYNLTVGGNIQIGAGADTGRKTLNAVSASTSTRNSIITVGGNWLNYGNGTVPSQFIAASSTVVFSSISTGKTITSGATNSAFNNVQFNGVGGAWTLQDPLVTNGSLTHSAGTLNANGNNITTTGNLTISDGALVTASGLNSTVYYNQMTVSGTLSPDTTGTYTIAGMNDGAPYYRNGSYYLYRDDHAHYWTISTVLNAYFIGGGAYPLGKWINGNSVLLNPNIYTPSGSSTGNATIANVTASGFIGSIWTVGGNFSASGNSGTLLTLNPTSTWYLNVSGTANANYVNVANSNANGGSAVTVSNSTDSGNNANWSFDLIAPTTTATAVANSNPYTFSTWTNSDVTVTLDCADDVGGSGCASGYPKYCLDTDNTCTPITTYVSPITISSSSETYIRFYSVDARNNIETVSSQLIQIDKATPVISNLAPVTGSNISKSGQTVTFTTNKPSACRFALSAKSFDEMISDYSCSVANSIQMTCALPEFNYGTQNIYFACEDYLGNKDTADTATHANYNVPQPPSGGMIFWPPTPAPVIILPTTTSSTVTVVPTAPKVAPVITINQGTKVATKPKVIITLTPTPGTTAVIISTNPDFSGAVTLPFVASPTGQASFEYDLCQGETSCLNQNYTVYTKFLDASGNDSPAFSANINLKLPNLNIPTISIGEQIKTGISGIINFLNPIAEVKMNFPPLAVAVPKETPIAFQNKFSLILASMSDFVFATLPRDFMTVANKFPQVASALKDVGVTRMSDAGQLEVAQISLPGLSEVKGLSGMKNVAITEMTKTQSQQVPTNMVFARGGQNNLDLNVKLSISNQGTAVQTLNTIQGHPLTLAIKPDQPAKTVKGYLIFKSNHVGEANVDEQVAQPVVKSVMNLLATPASAAEVKAGVNIGTVNTSPKTATDNSKEAPDLVLSQFEYKDSGNGVWTADVASPLVLGQYELRTVVEYKNKQATPETVSMVVIVDPEGYVFQKLSNGKETRIPDAVVTIYQLNPETKQYEIWSAGDFRQDNPQTTDVTGRYAFLVPPGEYYLTAKASGYGDYQSDIFKVQENKGVFMNLELKEKFSLASILNLQTILLGGIFIIMSGILLTLVLMLVAKRKSAR